MVEIRDVFGDLPVLETERLLLRRIAPGDLEDIYEYASDPEVARFTSWAAHSSLEDSRALVEFALGQYEAGRSLPGSSNTVRTAR